VSFPESPDVFFEVKQPGWQGERWPRRTADRRNPPPQAKQECIARVREDKYLGGDGREQQNGLLSRRFCRESWSFATLLVAATGCWCFFSHAGGDPLANRTEVRRSAIDFGHSQAQAVHESSVGSRMVAPWMIFAVIVVPGERSRSQLVQHADTSFEWRINGSRRPRHAAQSRVSAPSRNGLVLYRSSVSIKGAALRCDGHAPCSRRPTIRRR
jgi:hypothetical protein